MKKYKILAILIIIAAGVLVWHFGLVKKSYVSQVPAEVKNFASSTLTSIAQNISLPPPLQSAVQNPNAALTNAGVISWTNTNRQQNGNLPPLTQNQILDREAAAKLADMFKQQYFAHVNPQGQGPDYLAKTFGYSYISIGENLALGNFKNDQDLLTAWMNSPGHRANILNVKYRQIGVAVGQGMYDGQKTWLAVQEFGEPASVCPSIDSNLKIEIDSLQATVNQTGTELATEKAQIDSSNPQTQSQYSAYNAAVANYNNQVAIYNNQVDNLKLDTTTYNAQVMAYNSCAGL